ncbi:nucleoside deaminase [Haloarcula sp. Atlit-47R]|uniref:nucleoside deaminase n=1 Tax=Haloarcula sp. Atlit-47R TaxID=2282132 RepID=UPI000EF2426C|nr:nucleoside deaminase [Haloarcula sp. Atlit-47R]RLM44982.1 nucleoside deaminase [Haloarcula sp. Atlit-47R]
MPVSAFDEFDHEAHMQRAFERARAAVDRSDRPFGSVLVRDDEIVMEASNRVRTESDVRRHPELQLAHRAMRECDSDERAKIVLYTSTEPCPMCAGGLRYAGLGKVVYSVSSEEMNRFSGHEVSVRSGQILSSVTEVVGPICQ